MTQVPVFPLNTVVFPGAVVPLHVFEDRYRALMRDLLELPDGADRVFVIVAIRDGYEVGERSVHSLHQVGTLVQLTEAERHPDGEYDVEVTGRTRFRIDRMHRPAEPGEYLRADGEPLSQHDRRTGDAGDNDDEVTSTLLVFERYRETLSALNGAPVLAGAMPRDPEFLSWTLAGTCLLSLAQRQDVLEVDDAPTRLRLLRHLLREELRAMQAIPSLPATEIARTRWSPN